MALAMLLALAITAFVLYAIVSRVLTPSAAATTSTVYSGTPGTVATLNTSTSAPTNTGTTTAGGTKGSLLIRPRVATSSSSLASTNLTDFRATNLLDGDTSTAWVEGANGTGAGQWVKLEFDSTIPLARIEIANGYQQDAQSFADYVRVKDLQLAYSDGTKQVVELLDETGLQLIQPSAAQTQWIKFTILSVYPTYKFPQAALSEIQVYETVQ